MWGRAGFDVEKECRAQLLKRGFYIGEGCVKPTPGERPPLPHTKGDRNVLSVTTRIIRAIRERPVERPVAKPHLGIYTPQAIHACSAPGQPRKFNLPKMSATVARTDASAGRTRRFLHLY